MKTGGGKGAKPATKRSNTKMAPTTRVKKALPKTKKSPKTCVAEKSESIRKGSSDRDKVKKKIYG